MGLFRESNNPIVSTLDGSASVWDFIVSKDEQMRLIQDLQDFIKSQPTTITEFDETLVKRLITKITVFEDHFTVAFKSGVIIEIEA